MKLASLRTGGRDGTLVVVRHDLTAWLPATSVAPTLQAALDDWQALAPALAALAARVEVDPAAVPLDPAQLAAPLPRAYEWIDGSAFLNHVRLVRQARGAEMPPSFLVDPLVYQGGSGVLLGPRDPIALADEAWGCDFESEVCVVLGDVPQGTTAAQAEACVRLVMIANDVSLRGLIPAELAKGFGFFQSKPATAFSPVAVTPDELGDAWRGGRVHLRLRTWLDGKLVGDPHAGPEMQFSFFELIAHLAKTRAFTAGTILGSGTVSNADRARGVSCLAESRMIETIEQGAPATPFLGYGARVRIEMEGLDGRTVFGAIEQVVVPTGEGT